MTLQGCAPQGRRVVAAVMSTEQRIRELAYHLWIKEGRPEGHHDEHWKEAARRIAGESGEEGLVPEAGGLSSKAVRPAKTKSPRKPSAATSGATRPSRRKPRVSKTRPPENAS